MITNSYLLLKKKLPSAYPHLVTRQLLNMKLIQSCRGHSGHRVARVYKFGDVLFKILEDFSLESLSLPGSSYVLVDGASAFVEHIVHNQERDSVLVKVIVTKAENGVDSLCGKIFEFKLKDFAAGCPEPYEIAFSQNPKGLALDDMNSLFYQFDEETS